MSMSWKTKQNKTQCMGDWSRLKEAKELWQPTATCNPWLNTELKKKKAIKDILGTIGEIWMGAVY